MWFAESCRYCVLVHTVRPTDLNLPCPVGGKDPGKRNPGTGSGGSALQSQCPTACAVLGNDAQFVYGWYSVQETNWVPVDL